MQISGCIFNAGLMCSSRESCRHCGWNPVEAANRTIRIQELLRTNQRSIDHPTRLIIPRRESGAVQ